MLGVGTWMSETKSWLIALSIVGTMTIGAIGIAIMITEVVKWHLQQTRSHALVFVIMEITHKGFKVNVINVKARGWLLINQSVSNKPEWYFSQALCGCLYDEFGVNAKYCNFHNRWQIKRTNSNPWKEDYLMFVILVILNLENVRVIVWINKH